MKRMLTIYCTQYSTTCTNNSAKLAYSYILDYSLLFLHPYPPLQSGIAVTYSEILPEYNAISLYHGELFHGTHHSYFTFDKNIVENAVHYII